MTVANGASHDRAASMLSDVTHARDETGRQNDFRLKRRTTPGPRVRPLHPDDIPQLCAMFGQTFRVGRNVRLDDIADVFRQLYLTSPLDRTSPASLVDVDPDGRVSGFIGTITLRAVLDGRSLKVGILGNFMADTADRARVALRLMRATQAQDIDLLFTDTANPRSLALGRALKYEFLPFQSLEWVKVLRPAGAACSVLGKRLPVAATLMAPLARLVDVGARCLPLTALPALDDDRISDQEVGPMSFAERAPGLAERYGLRPDWTDGRDLAWLLEQARQKTRNGLLQTREVVDRSGRALGLYLLYVRPGGVAHALQILAHPRQDRIVLAALMRHAAASGAVAVRGAASPDIMEALSQHSGVFYRQTASAVVFTRDTAIRNALQRGNAMIGGLMGESWTRLVADEFARPSKLLQRIFPAPVAA